MIESVDDYSEKYKEVWNRSSPNKIYYTGDEILEELSSTDIETLADRITDELEDEPNPFFYFDRQDMIDCYRHLKSVSSANKVLQQTEWFARGWQSRDFVTGPFIQSCKTGSFASTYFHMENMIEVHAKGEISSSEQWSNRKKRYQVVKYLISFIRKGHRDNFSQKTLKSIINLAGYKPTNFKPGTAKLLYDYFGAERILDPSAGWGDRLAGFFTSRQGKEYVGIDPNPNTHPKYEEQIATYKQLNENPFWGRSKEARMIQDAAEDVDLSEYKGFFDLVFTSPPYYDLEIYDDGAKQSSERYSSYDGWFKGFMEPMIENVYPTIREGGYLALNLADVRKDKGDGKYPLIDDTISFIGKEPTEVIGMEISIRPKTYQRIDKDFKYAGEPILVFKKD